MLSSWKTLILLLFGLAIFACSEDESQPLETDGDTDAFDASEIEKLADGDEAETCETNELEGGEEEIDEAPTCFEPIPARVLDDQPDETFDIGPYLMQPKPTSIIVKWRSVEEEDGEVLYGLDETLGLSKVEEGVSNLHEIKIDDLTPNTRYFYRVRSGERTGEIHHFYTAPTPEQGFSAVIWGDSQSHPERFAQHVDHMIALNPYLALGVGDHVSEGGVFSQWKERLFGPARGLFHEVGFYAAIGNHARNHQNWYDFMSFPHPEDDPQHESFYSFTYGNAFFLVIDTDKPYFPIGHVDTDISAFVKEQVASPEAQAAKWRFALSHVPGFAEAWGDGACDDYGTNPSIKGWFYELLNEHEFHAHFSGHMHGYERGQSENLVTLITGGGGGGLDAWCDELPEVSVVHYVHHFLHMEIGCETTRISAYDLDGALFDWVEISADDYGTILDEGPIDGLPEPPIDSDSPHYEAEN